MEKSQLVFVPWAGMGHLVPSVELSKILLARDHRLSITVFILNPSIFNFNPVHNYIESLQSYSSTVSDRLRFVVLPKDESELFHYTSFFEVQKTHVKESVSKITQSESAPRLAGFIIDMFCSPILDVANEFNAPSYSFYTTSAAFIGLMLYVQKIHDQDEEKFDLAELVNSNSELPISSLVNPFPAKLMPSAMLSKEWLPPFIENARRYGEAKGILINTFSELESYAIESLKTLKSPPVYPVGPILDVGSAGSDGHQEIMQWLDDQPPSSVVFLCFGSMGSLSEEQVKEIASALEHSGYRFLWILRRPPPPGKLSSPADYEDPRDVLPEGFLYRTAEIGKVTGWAPQVAVLAHRAIGGFVSHCGWNSVLESIWYGVPIATWPLYSEQQLNAFEMVMELGLAVEIKMDYNKDNGMIVKCDEIEKGIRCLMEHGSEMRKKYKEMSENSRKALMDGGSSSLQLDHFIKDVMDNFVQ